MQSRQIHHVVACMQAGTHSYIRSHNNCVLKLQMKLDSVRWFSHWRSPSPRAVTQWYRLCCLMRTAYDARSTMHYQRGWLSSFFSFFVPGDLDLWLLTLTLEFVRDFCTVHLTPSFIFIRQVVRKLSCGQTNWQTRQHVLIFPPA